jgi:hypothetical protein
MTVPYEKKLMGDIIGMGGEHVVYEYGETQVIKFSWHVFISGKTAVKKLIDDYAIGVSYFKDYLLPTRIEMWKDGREAAEFQERIQCRPFTQDDMRVRDLRAQLHDIFERHARMRAETGCTLDIFGLKGLIGVKPHREISNIQVTDTGRLIILDFTLMHIRPEWYEWPLVWFLKWAQRRQDRILHKYWKDV